METEKYVNAHSTEMLTFSYYSQAPASVRMDAHEMLIACVLLLARICQKSLALSGPAGIAFDSQSTWVWIWAMPENGLFHGYRNLREDSSKKNFFNIKKKLQVTA